MRTTNPTQDARNKLYDMTDQTPIEEGRGVINQARTVGKMKASHGSSS